MTKLKIRLLAFRKAWRLYPKGWLFVLSFLSVFSLALYILFPCATTLFTFLFDIFAWLSLILFAWFYSRRFLRSHGSEHP